MKNIRFIIGPDGTAYRMVRNGRFGPDTIAAIADDSELRQCLNEQQLRSFIFITRNGATASFRIEWRKWQGSKYPYWYGTKFGTAGLKHAYLCRERAITLSGLERVTESLCADDSVATRQYVSESWATQLESLTVNASVPVASEPVTDAAETIQALQKFLGLPQLEQALEVLGFSSVPDAETLKRRHHELAIQLHPDRQSSSDTLAEMQRVNEAYTVVKKFVAR